MRGAVHTHGLAAATPARCVTALLCSAVLPGLGHLVLARGVADAARQRLRRTGRTLLAITLLLLVATATVLAIVASSPASVVAVATSAPTLGWITAALVAVALYSAAVTTHLYLSTGGASTSPTGGVRRPLAVIAAATVAVVLPVAALGSVASITDAQRGLVAGLFADGAGLAPVDGRYNILVMGIDKDPAREQVLLPDSLTVVSVDAVTGRAVLFGVPRTAANFLYPEGSALAEALPDGTRCRAGCGVNHTYQYGVEHPELYPDSDDPGAAAMRDAVGGYTGLEIGASVSIKMAGFVDLIDALGGVTVTVNRPVLRAGVPDDGSGVPNSYGDPIGTGVQHLDGESALWFARSRIGTSDDDRAQRQGCIQAALFQQITPATVLANFTELARSGAETVSTDIPASALPALAELAMKSRAFPFERVELTEPITLPEHPVIERVHAAVAAAIAGEGTDAAVTETAPPADDSGEGATPPPGTGSEPSPGSEPGFAQAPEHTEGPVAACSVG